MWQDNYSLQQPAFDIGNLIDTRKALSPNFLRVGTAVKFMQQHDLQCYLSNRHTGLMTILTHL